MRKMEDMAQEAGMTGLEAGGLFDNFLLFEQLVRADEREELLQNSVQAHEVEAFRDVVTCNAIRARGNT